MFSPAIRRPHLPNRRDMAEEFQSPPPAAPAHSLSPRGFAVPDRPATGTPAPWNSSLLTRISTSKRADRTGDSDQIQPVHVADFPRVVRNAQASLKNFSGKNMLAGGIDKETSLAWMICGNELFIWNYLVSVAKDCIVLDIPSSLIGYNDVKPLLSIQWTVCIMRWHNSGASTRNSGEMLHRKSSTGVILCNKRTQAVAYWPDISAESSRSPVLSSSDHGEVSTCGAASDFLRFNSLIAAAVPGCIHECIAIASEPAGALWLFQCSPEGIRQRKVHADTLGDGGSDLYQKCDGGRSLVWLPSNVSSEGSDRKFFLLTNNEVQCWSISLLHDINVKKLGSHEIVGTDGDVGIKKDIAGQKNIWLLDMQIDEHGKEFSILVATLCKDRVSGSNYTQYSLLTMMYKPNQKFSSEDNVAKVERFLEKARRNMVLLMDRDNAEVFYSRVSDIEDLFYCLSHELQYIISREEHPSVQMQRALELANACITIVQAASHYKKDHKEWYPSPEGLITWNSQPVLRSGIWNLASLIMELLGESGAADMSMKSSLWSQLEGLTDILLEAYMCLLTAQFERGQEHGVLVQEYCERRDELLRSLYNLAKQIVEAKYQESCVSFHK
ncbi:Nuclear pore complex protein NUP133 [Zea mays]|uniref:Nuclear pore complex protein NUP133 n=1 Tax=Zea mays TaxID=4577 RepID=A0A1D6PFT4_MAIZE|nr:Nuclear pore complex protein NUP133 [Zea mays]